MKKMILAAMTLAAASTSRGQANLGVEGGLNMANYIQKYGDNIRPSEYVSGVRIGVIIDGAIGRRCFLQSGLSYVQNGTKFYIYNTSYYPVPLTMNVNSLVLPVNFIYKTGKQYRNHFFVGGGLTFGVNINGSSTTVPKTIYNRDLRIGSEKTNDLKRLEAGGCINMGIEFKKGLFFRAGYHTGFTNLNPISNSTDAILVKNRNISLTFGFLIRKTMHKVKRSK
ncbi:porin family protein [Flavipsychrobacter stenotrophus]|nr:porin family protein [Flavipsychrobacter stenotrophus]